MIKASVTQITIPIVDPSQEEINDIISTINAYHGALYVSANASQEEMYQVQVVDDGRVLQTGAATEVALMNEIKKFAASRGWIEPCSEPEVLGGDRLYQVDLAQFDAWNLGYCAQIAAFGEFIVD